MDSALEQAPDTLVAFRLDQMAVTSDLLASNSDLTIVLHELALRARTVTAADYAAISTFDDEGKLTRFVYAGMSEEDARRLGDPPAGRGLLGLLASRDRPLKVEDLTKHEASSGWPTGHPDMCAFLGVPLRAGGKTIGSLYMTRIRGAAPFSSADELAAGILGLQAAVGVAAGLANERSGRLYLLEERERIAHDLHDGTIQTLYALGLELDAMANNDAFTAVAHEALETAVERINTLISDIRQYITMLEAETPHAQPDLARDLAFVVRQIVPAGVDTVTNVTAAALQELTGRQSEDLLYIAREALSNAVRHGLPTKVAIDLRQAAAETALTIQDNGIGFDPANVRMGLGTVTMRTRTERLGAHLSVLGIPGMGTTVRVSIPREVQP